MVKHAHRQAKPLALSFQERLRALVKKFGEHGAAEKIGVTTTALARALAGFGIRQGTAVAIEARLDLLEANQTKRSTK